MEGFEGYICFVKWDDSIVGFFFLKIIKERPLQLMAIVIGPC